MIKQVFKENKGTYYSPRITANLKRQGYLIFKQRVAKLIRKEDWISTSKERFKVTTDSKHGYSISENNLNRNFKQRS